MVAAILAVAGRTIGPDSDPSTIAAGRGAFLAIRPIHGRGKLARQMHFYRRVVA